MVVVPVLTAVTKPVEETVATAVLLDIQGFVVAAVPLPVSWEVVPAHNAVVPVMDGIFGVTVTVEELFVFTGSSRFPEIVAVLL